jgi:hypothetical protein
MGSQGETAFAQDPLDPILFHIRSLGCSRGLRTLQPGDDHIGILDIAKRIVEGGQ